jgi:polysaccharide export outer membrane protein
MEETGQSFKMENKYGLKVFLVDNDSFCLNIYRRQLNNLGYGHVTLFNNSDDGLDSLTDKPDVVFLGYGMDALNGHEMLKRIKRFNPDIYVVFITGAESVEAAKNSLKYGAFDYAIKTNDELEGAGKILTSIYEIVQVFKNTQPSLVKKFPC